MGDPAGNCPKLHPGRKQRHPYRTKEPNASPGQLTRTTSTIVLFQSEFGIRTKQSKQKTNDDNGPKQAQPGNRRDGKSPDHGGHAQPLREKKRPSVLPGKLVGSEYKLRENIDRRHAATRKGPQKPRGSKANEGRAKKQANQNPQGVKPQ